MSGYIIGLLIEANCNSYKDFKFRVDCCKFRARWWINEEPEIIQQGYYSIRIQEKVKEFFENQDLQFNS